MFLKVYNLFMDIKEIIYNELHKITSMKFNDKTNISNLEIDSLSFVELITEMEEKLDVEVSDEDLEKIKTVGDIVKTIKKVTK